MKKSIITLSLILAGLCLSVNSVYSFSSTGPNSPMDDESYFVCGVQINSVIELNVLGDDDVVFVANITLQPGTSITSAFFDLTFQSGATSGLVGTVISPTAVRAIAPVSCSDRVTSVRVTLHGQKGSSSCQDQFVENFQFGVCGTGGGFDF